MADGEGRVGGSGPDHRRPHNPSTERVTSALFPDAQQIPVVELRELREQTQEPHWLNVPNALTFLRALLVPVILWLLAQEDVSARWWAFGIFLFAAATDSVDGWVARRWHGVTRWGQLADPIADKLLIMGSLAALAAVRRLPWWAVGVIAVREVAVTFLRLVLIRRRDLVMPASPWGKSKTVSQIVAVVAYLWPGLDATLRAWLLGIAIVLTVLSGIDYAFRAGRLTREVDA
ncbi:MAG TPA: CDP-diacylglycerol--glycerol-3-phosphate 3-phosphatidyltransferase [Nitriliruptorales bacterium]